ncbi:MAG TPA: hypothetical protein VGI85_15630, partial [Chthoniobacterales bacterium]
MSHDTSTLIHPMLALRVAVDASPLGSVRLRAAREKQVSSARPAGVTDPGYNQNSYTSASTFTPVGGILSV